MKNCRFILHRVGWILIIGGLIDVGLMIYCIANRKSYSSSFNIFAIIAGFFLLKGSLRAARIISFFMAFFIACFAGVLVIIPFFFPIDLLIIYFKLEPISTLLAVVVGSIIVILLVWVYRELTSSPVRIAMDEAKVNYASFWHKPVRGFWIGGCLIVLAFIFLFLLLNSNTAEQAKQKAAAQIGPGYKFRVKNINISSGTGGKHVQAVVTAYNDKEVNDIVVEWAE
jgi:hypothetical protein